MLPKGFSYNLESKVKHTTYHNIQNRKYFGINLTKYVQDLYAKTTKHSYKELNKTCTTQFQNLL